MNQRTNQSLTWRTYLGQLLDVPTEKQRVANALGVSSLTLTRWVNGTTEPRPGSLKKLPSVFPQHGQRLAELIREAYDPGGARSPAPGDHFRTAIPPEFSARVLSAFARTTGPIVTSSICHLVLRQAIDHLDPDHLGMEITVAQCTPPTSGLPVRSLVERIGVGTPPWTKGVGRRLLFLGAEALAGYVVGTGEPGIVQNIEEEHGPLPVRPGAYEKSAAAYPLLRRGRLAGCFLVSSAQIDFFLPERTDLVEQYANLLALAYTDEQFYRPKEILLEVMPPISVQELSTLPFRQRVLEHRRTAHLSETEAEQWVIQEIEAELLLKTLDAQPSGTNSLELHI